VRSPFHTNVSTDAFRPHTSISAVEHGIRMTSTGSKHNERFDQFAPETGAPLTPLTASAYEMDPAPTGLSGPQSRRDRSRLDCFPTCRFRLDARTR
jgi:hypothetical protein